MRGARPQVAGLQLRAGAAQERRLFLHPCCPCHPCPAHTLPLRPQPRRGAKGTTPGCGSPPAMRALHHRKFGCRCLSEGVFGEEGAARPGQGAGGRV